MNSQNKQPIETSQLIQPTIQKPKNWYKYGFWGILAISGIIIFLYLIAYLYGYSLQSRYFPSESDISSPEIKIITSSPSPMLKSSPTPQTIIKPILNQFESVCSVQNRNIKSNFEFNPNLTTFQFKTPIKLSSTSCMMMGEGLEYQFDIEIKDKYISVFPRDGKGEDWTRLNLYNRGVKSSDGISIYSSINTISEACPIRSPIALEYNIVASKDFIYQGYNYTFIAKYNINDERDQKIMTLLKPYLIENVGCTDSLNTKYLMLNESYYENENIILDKIDKEYQIELNKVIYQNKNIKQILSQILNSVEFK